jgi:peptidoglycan/xylan/chitin deacetylase (PgdA/CDA1 family)
VAIVIVAIVTSLGIGAFDAGYGSTGPVPLRAASSPVPSPPSSTSILAPDDPVNAYLPRIPRFGPRPTPVPIGPLAGEAAWVSRIPTDQPVAFITIDDGWTKHPMAASLLRASKVPVTLFLAVNAIKDDPMYFRSLQRAGAVIEAHTLSHPPLRGKPYPTQHREICGSADRLAEWYERRPVLFRPPFGEKDANTLAAGASCGIKARSSDRRRQGRGPLPGRQPGAAGRRHPHALPPGVPRRLPRGAHGHPRRGAHPGAAGGLRGLTGGPTGGSGGWVWRVTSRAAVRR